MENGFTDAVDLAGNLLEAAGVLVTVIGAVAAALVAFRRRSDAAANRYRAYRQALGKAILLGLEFLVAADIVRTVSHVPSLRQVAVLGGIVLIRTFLSFTLEVELEGRWPWQRPPGSGRSRASPGRATGPRLAGFGASCEARHRVRGRVRGPAQRGAIAGDVSGSRRAAAPSRAGGLG